MKNLERTMVMRLRLLLLTCTVLLTAAGCGTTGNQAGEANPNEHNVRVQQTSPEQGPATAADTSTRLEFLAKSIPDVQDAKCVLIGNTAIVGLTVDPALDRSRVNTIKYSVAEAFRKDPAGINAFVTADMGLGERIRHVREDITNGRPFSGFAQELGDLISRVAPQLPRDIEPMDDQRGHDPDASQFESNNL
jgi:YhcN/YlaJ family sporulation lipoprotein